MQDTGLFRQNTKDQFYTKQEVANECVLDILSYLPEATSWTWLEPSAGTGSFLKAVPKEVKVISYDIEPKYPTTVKANFLEQSFQFTGKVIVFGNPPFGSQASVAKSFIKHSAKIADVIAFILPRSFQKPSMNKVFPREFHCIHTKELLPKSFEVNEKEYGVPCIFQIWQKKSELRPIEEFLAPIGFEFVKSLIKHDIVIRRVGANAGQANILGDVYNPETHYFIKLNNGLLRYQLNIIQQLNATKYPANTTGPKSLSKFEITNVLNPILSSFSDAMRMHN